MSGASSRPWKPTLAVHRGLPVANEDDHGRHQRQPAPAHELTPAPTDRADRTGSRSRPRRRTPSSSSITTTGTAGSSGHVPEAPTEAGPPEHALRRERAREREAAEPSDRQADPRGAAAAGDHGRSSRASRATSAADRREQRVRVRLVTDREIDRAAGSSAPIATARKSSPALWKTFHTANTDPAAYQSSTIGQRSRRRHEDGAAVVARSRCPPRDRDGCGRPRSRGSRAGIPGTCRRRAARRPAP